MVGFSNRRVTLCNNNAACGEDRLPHDPIVFPSPDIVGAYEIGDRSVVVEQEIGERNDMLIGAGPSVNRILATLKSFVVRGIPEHSVIFFEVGLHLLPARRGVASDDVRETAI